mgnify:CR=1 FL=1
MTARWTCAIEALAERGGQLRVAERQRLEPPQAVDALRQHVVAVDDEIAGHDVLGGAGPRRQPPLLQVHGRHFTGTQRQQVAALAAARLPEFVFAQGEAQMGRFLADGTLDESGGGRILMQRGPQLFKQLVAFDFLHLLQLLQSPPQAL